MSVNDKIRAYNGVITYLSKFDIGKPRTKSYRSYDEHINNILIDFLKSIGVRCVKNNSPKYRGSYQPVLDNSCDAQEHFSKFASYIKNRYNKLNN